MTKENDVTREILNKIIQEIDTIKYFDESRAKEIKQKIFRIIKLTKLCALSIRSEAFFLNVSLTNSWAPFLFDFEGKEYLLRYLYCIRESLSEYLKKLNSIKHEIKNLNSEEKLTLTLKRISIISKIVRGKYNEIADIREKIVGDNELTRKKTN